MATTFLILLTLFLHTGQGQLLRSFDDKNVIFSLTESSMSWIDAAKVKVYFYNELTQWGTFYIFIAKVFVTQNVGGTKELVVLLWLISKINNEVKE